MANFLIALGTFGFMEFWAWFMHRFVQHGPLWFLHRSHHVRHPHPVERNDLFFVLYGALSAVLFISGDVVSAQTALDMGLVTFLAPKAELVDNVRAYAQRLCRENSGQSMEVTKDMLARLPEMPLEDGLRYAAQRNAEARGSEDCRRGIAAFLNKEKISW